MTLKNSEMSQISIQITFNILREQQMDDSQDLQ